MLDLLLYSRSSYFLVFFFLFYSDLVIFIVLSLGSPVLSSILLSILLLSPSVEFLILVTIFSILQFPFSSSLYLLSLCWDFLFPCWYCLHFHCFSLVCNCSLKHFYDGCFCLCHIILTAFPSVLATFDCLFYSNWDFTGSLYEEWFFFFLLRPGHFCCRTLALTETFCFSWPPDTAQAEAGEALYSCLVSRNSGSPLSFCCHPRGVPIPHKAFPDTWGGCLLTTG